MLGMATQASHAIGIDVGGGSVVAGVVRRDGAVVARQDMPTDSRRGIDDGLRRIAALVEVVISQAGVARDDLAGIGIGSSAPIDAAAGTINNPYTLPGWDGIPIGPHLSGRFGLPFALLGDCEAAALGEHWIGAGRGARSMVYITVGTGIGSGIVIDNQLHRGVALSTCEVGHHVIDLNGPPCYCGARGCLEMFAAAPAIVARAQAAWDDAPELRRLCDGDPARVTAKCVYDAAQAGDVAALRVMRDTGRYLGIGMANVLNILAPEALVLGGGVMQGWDLIVPPMFDVIHSRDAMVPFRRITIARAALGLNAGVTGAAKVIFVRA